MSNDRPTRRNLILKFVVWNLERIKNIKPHQIIKKLGTAYTLRFSSRIISGTLPQSNILEIKPHNVDMVQITSSESNPTLGKYVSESNIVLGKYSFDKSFILSTFLKNHQAVLALRRELEEIRQELETLLQELLELVEIREKLEQALLERYPIDPHLSRRPRILETRQYKTFKEIVENNRLINKYSLSTIDKSKRVCKKKLLIVREKVQTYFMTLESVMMEIGLASDNPTLEKYLSHKFSILSPFPRRTHKIRQESETLTQEFKEIGQELQRLESSERFKFFTEFTE